MTISNEIMEMVETSLHITYDLDESSLIRLENEIAAGIAYIRKYCDPAATCGPGTESGELLCSYVLRAEAGALETFYRDFGTEINSMKLQTDTERYAEAMGYCED